MLAKKHTRRWIVTAALVFSVAGVLVVPTVFARIVRNTIDPVATIADDGRFITVTGPVSCNQVQWIDQRVTVTQRNTGAVAEGRSHFLCTPDVQQWTVEAAAQGRSRFEEGPATAGAIAVTKVLGQPDDAHQWLVDLALAVE